MLTTMLPSDVGPGIVGVTLCMTAGEGAVGKHVLTLHDIYITIGGILTQNTFDNVGNAELLLRYTNDITKAEIV